MLLLLVVLTYGNTTNEIKSCVSGNKNAAQVKLKNSANHTPTLHGDLSGIVVKYGGCAYEVPKHLN